MNRPRGEGGGGGGGGGGRRRRRGGRSGRRGGTRGGGNNRGGGGRGRKVVDAVPEGEPTLETQGVLQLAEQGHGFLRSPQQDFRIESDDVIVPRALIRELALVDGADLVGRAIESENGRAPVLAEVASINGLDAEGWSERTPFKDLVADSPRERLRLEADPADLSTRVVDLVAPIGKGQRCLIVAPPKAGKTVLLQRIAASLTANHPEVHLIVLLVDERPEEVTDMRRSVQGEVVASSSDETAANHVRAAEVVLERAKCMVEAGRDVVVLLDSITRLARAYNNQQRGSGRVLSGGIDARTMEKPRRFFGAARNVEGGGSLTVIGTALVDTGSRMDEVIFQEFKGTGNTEIVMDRRMFEMRIFPAIDIAQTGTRREEVLLNEFEYERISLLRRALSSLRAPEAMRMLTERLGKHPNNEAFLKTLE